VKNFLLAAVVFALSGCTSSLGRMGILAPDATRVGVKLLRPGVSARSCGTTLLGVPLGSSEPALAAALGKLMELDSEGSAVVAVEVTTEDFLTGIYNRRCVAVHGDLVRVVTTVVLPSAPGHPHH
jgi:hypothetical protein